MERNDISIAERREAFLARAEKRIKERSVKTRISKTFTRRFGRLRGAV